MIALRWIIAVAAMAFVLPAHAATTDPIQIIYRTSGVTDNGASATAFHCTNLSAVTELVRVVVRHRTGEIAGNVEVPLPSFNTVTGSTRLTALFIGFSLATGIVNQGTAVVASTTTFIFCSAMIVETTASTPQGIALHLVRFNPMPDTTE